MIGRGEPTAVLAPAAEGVVEVTSVQSGRISGGAAGAVGVGRVGRYFADEGRSKADPTHKVSIRRSARGAVHVTNAGSREVHRRKGIRIGGSALAPASIVSSNQEISGEL